MPIEDQKRFLILRVPNVGPKALAGPPNDFASREAAQKRVDDIYATQLKRHHTVLEIAEYRGDKFAFLTAERILY